MKVAFLIMSTNEEPSLSNIQAMKESFIKWHNELKEKKELQHEYDFIFYFGNSEAELKVNENEVSKNIVVNTKETIYRTFEKTIWTLQSLNEEYDWYIRINISCFINMKVLDNIISELDKEVVYCNAINSIISDSEYLNDIYPRGDTIIMHNNVKNGILKYSEKYMYNDTADENRLNVVHVDDVLIGLCLIDYFGNSYYEHIRMLDYNFLPNTRDKLSNVELNPNALATRVKTMPPGVTYSGYSWKDNNYRRDDGLKMISLYNALNKVDFSDVHLNKILVPLDKGRPTLLVHIENQHINLFHNILKQKRAPKK